MRGLALPGLAMALNRHQETAATLTFTHIRDGGEDIMTAEVEGEPRQHLKRAATSVPLSHEDVQKLFAGILKKGHK
jgi:membrane glycosyltransferase